MSLRVCEVMSEQDAVMLNALQLAYIGDSVWETIIRGILVHRRMNVHHMHSECVKLVNAHAQADFLRKLDSFLSDRELEIIRRGRNSHAHHSAPKNQNPEDYAAATGFEALIGYLYMTGQEDRIMKITEIITGGIPDG